MRKVLIGIASIIVCVLIGAYAYLSGKEYVITIPENDIAEKLNDKLPLEKTYLLIFSVSLDNPRVDLMAGSNRINGGLDLTLNIKVGNEDRPLGGAVDVSGNLAYEPELGAFFLIDPVIENLDLQGVPKMYSAKISTVVEKALAHFYSTRPLYRLKSTDVKQSLARLVLKKVEVESEAVVVTLGL